MIRRIAILTAFICITAAQTLPLAQEVKGAFSPEKYKEALWMVTRFYGGQRSGSGPNWILMGHPNEAYRTAFTGDKDSETGYDISGGWFDCGDNMMFGQTFFFTAYMLATAYEAFPTGFHDLYHGKDYSDYAASAVSKNECKDWNIGCGEPSGMPDILEELKYATDYIIKATPNDSTFYYEKGLAEYDHNGWVSAGYKSKQSVTSGGEPRPIRKNTDDGAMPSFAAAALAKMSRIYREHDADYANLCFEHAKKAYAYAKPRKDKAVPSVSTHAGTTENCYGPNDVPTTVFLTAAAEMYRTSGAQTYKDDIDENINARVTHWWAFDYETPNDLAPYALACALPDAKNNHMQFLKSSFLDNYTKSSNINSEKISAISGTEWGALRYAANHAFSAALYSVATGTSNYDQFIYDQIDYILGENNAKQSFLVGFCDGCEKEVKKPHHANVYLSDANAINSVTIPERNKYFGFMVGGTHKSSDFPDNINDYQTAEGGSDYNAGLLGALAYIVSKVAPANPTGIKRISTGNTVQKKHGVSVSRKSKSVVFSAAQGRTIERLSVHTLSGRQVFKHSGSVSEIRWKESAAPRGLYLAKITLNGGTVVQHSVLLR
ncbi:MAG: glycoside hydrolase family 9 protein [Chitinispirillales bacterium]|jgi:hypothetical protein|nr:glycoside hydrolase family 9 protein [Chitinispirillales bacterium]